MKKGSLMILALLVVLAGIVSAQTSSEVVTAKSLICAMLTNVRNLLLAIAGGIGVVVITLNGIKWISSSDDPGARKQAKEGIIHAVVGLIIVLLAVALVSMVFTAGVCAGM